MGSPWTAEPWKLKFDNNQIVMIDQTIITKPALIDIQDSCPNPRRFSYRFPVSGLMQVERDGIDLLPLSDLEDEEIARHKERMIEINTIYQERISSFGIQHAARLRELLRKESQARLNLYQEAAISTHKTERGLTELCGYGRSMSTEAPTRYDL